MQLCTNVNNACKILGSRNLKILLEIDDFPNSLIVLKLYILDTTIRVILQIDANKKQHIFHFKSQIIEST